ncbi:MAG: RraA family protein [Anaerolineae bacterium]|jgi:regulator of RNase E activity RraA
MTGFLPPEVIDDLKAIDTPTICNAIEQFDVRGRIEGFFGMDIRCLLPELGSMVGYAITLTVDSTTPGIPRNDEVWHAWLKAMEESPKPSVLVMRDIGPQPRKSAHIGEVMGTIATRLGVVGIVTDGGIRDILELKELGFHCFAAGLVPSHGNPRLVEVNVAVQIDGVRIKPGDLLHGDANGVTIVPQSIAAQVADAAHQVRAREAEVLGYVKGPDFTVEGLFQRTVSH